MENTKNGSHNLKVVLLVLFILLFCCLISCGIIFAVAAPYYNDPKNCNFIAPWDQNKLNNCPIGNNNIPPFQPTTDNVPYDTLMPTVSAIPTPNNSSAPGSLTSDDMACWYASKDLTSVVQHFWTLEKAQDGKGVLALFSKIDNTTLEGQSDQKVYDYLTGRDDGSGIIRLYGNLSSGTNYRVDGTYISGYARLTDGPYDMDRPCTIEGYEMRAQYGGPTDPEYLSATAVKVDFTFVKENNQWKISSYSLGLGHDQPQKYGAFAEDLYTNFGY